ncbi:MAG: DNA gyrase inhibitor YacG [Alphaproteobacteria bacterium]|nr:DNA gyrase inhibitor YacG [Alphaproteobacteria bacterium]
MTNNKDSLCPICKKPATDAFKPFCSQRCADIDLHRWFNGSYVVHTNEEPNESDAANPDETPCPRT